MIELAQKRQPLAGRFSPLRYPGGKGKLARFVVELIHQNKLQDGTYVEPYAGGAAVAWQLLLTGVVRHVHINDLSRPVYSFWKSVLDNTDDLVQLVSDTKLDVSTWSRMKKILMQPQDHDDLSLGFAMFYLNRTNRSGILNGGPIGGQNQLGRWGIGARYNRDDLIQRIERIARLRRRIKLTNLDAATLLTSTQTWPKNTLIYLDPPYYVKGRELYYDFYNAHDHRNVAQAIRSVDRAAWIVSYDDVQPIHCLYPYVSWLQYQIGYSARKRTQGREAMFFSKGLVIPPIQGSMVEIDRWEVALSNPTFRAPLAPSEPGNTSSKEAA